jgi:glycolate oxidase subunit GlcD
MSSRCQTPGLHPLASDLLALLGGDAVAPAAPPWLTDATASRGIGGRADAVVRPATAEQVAEVVAWCYERGVAIVPRGGGTGFAAGAVPDPEGNGRGGPTVVLSLDRLRAVRALDPLQWRIHVEAGVTTGHVARLARENGLWYPPDPGSGETSHIGGNIATNAGGPHSFKYGVTGHWVTGLEVVLAPGELVRFGGAARKDVAGYDLRSLLIGSEGTLGIITAAWLRLLPAPQDACAVVALHRDAAAGGRALERALACGAIPAVLEYLDAGALAAAGASFPRPLPMGVEGAGGMLIIGEVDGPARSVAEEASLLREALGEEALALQTFATPAERRALWGWRDGVSLAVTARRGGKLSEDVAVPTEHLPRMIEATLEIAARHGLEACSWGHAGDGNLHSTFLLDPADPAEAERAHAAAGELFALAIELGGTVSGEHGLGLVKRGQLRHQWAPAAVEAHRAIKRALDPQNLLNPGKKLA